MAVDLAATAAPEAAIPPGLVRVRLAGRYDGAWFDADPEPTLKQFRVLISESLDGTLDTLRDLIGGWCLVDKAGQPMPPPPDPACWDGATLPLLRAMVVAYVAVLRTGADLPKG